MASIIVRRSPAALRTYRLEARRLPEIFERVHARSANHDLATVLSVFGLGPREAGRLFGVTRQAIELWLGGAVPPSRRVSVGRLADVARRHLALFRAERIPAIVAAANPGLEGRSVLETLRDEGGMERVMAALDRLSSYVPI